jgi:DNA-binding protein H-NS
MARAAQSTTAGSFNVASYSFEELQDIKRQVEAEIESRKAHEVQSLRAKVSESARSLGVSIEELFGLSSQSRRKAMRVTKHPRGKQPAKYRGPNGEEWSGRGPSPRWMKPLLVKGKTKADFLIK